MPRNQRCQCLISFWLDWAMQVILMKQMFGDASVCVIFLMVHHLKYVLNFFHHSKTPTPAVPRILQVKSNKLIKIRQRTGAWFFLPIHFFSKMGWIELLRSLRELKSFKCRPLRSISRPSLVRWRSTSWPVALFYNIYYLLHSWKKSRAMRVHGMQSQQTVQL